MISSAVGISIAGGGEEMVRAPISWLSFFLFFCNHALFVSRYKRPCAARAMKRKKPIKQTCAGFTSSWEKSDTPSL